MINGLALLLGLAVLLFSAMTITAVWAVNLAHTEGSVRAYSTPNFGQPANFKVKDLPLSRSLRLTGCFLLGKRLAHLEFAIDPDCKALLRVAPTGESLHLKDFEERYQNKTSLQKGEVTVCLQQNLHSETLATWSKAGFEYALYFPSGEFEFLYDTVERFAGQAIAVFLNQPSKKSC